MTNPTKSERAILRDLEVHGKTVRNGRYRKALRRLEAAELVSVEWDNDAAPHESEIHVVRRPRPADDWTVCPFCSADHDFEPPCEAALRGWLVLTADEAEVLVDLLDLLDIQWVAQGQPQEGSHREVLRRALNRDRAALPDLLRAAGFEVVHRTVRAGASPREGGRA